jgi:RHS repeat-associated protein
MVAARGPGLNKEAAVYTYDGLDRRDTKTESGQTTTYGYVASTNDLAIETTADTTTGANVTKRSYDYDANGNRQGQQAIAPSTTTAYRPYATDAQGSVQGLEDTTGAIPNGSTYSYDPYGNPQTTGTPSQASKDNPFRFQGFYYDPTAGGYNALAREYRPDIQRFLTQDRYEAAGADLQLAENSLTGDRYAFVAGNPTTSIENDGHLPREFSDNGIVKGDPSRPPTRRRHIGGFNLRTPASAPVTFRDLAVGEARSSQAQDEVGFLDTAAARPNDLPQCIPGTCSDGQASRFIRRFETHHPGKAELGWGKRFADYLVLGPGYAAGLSAEPEWLREASGGVNSFLELATGFQVAVGAEPTAGLTAGLRILLGSTEERTAAEIPTVVFSRSRAPGIASTFDAAVADGAPTTLNRTQDRALMRANRRDALRGQRAAPAGQSLDEYPFACTIQGGAGGCVRAVPRGEQHYQGGVLSSFFQRSGVADGDPFDVRFGP